MKEKRKTRILEGARQALAIARGELDGMESKPVIHLDAKDWAALKRVIENPPEPNERLRQLMRRRPPWKEGA